MARSGWSEWRILLLWTRTNSIDACLCQVSMTPTEQLAVLLETKAAFLSEYGAEKGESSFLLGI